MGQVTVKIPRALLKKSRHVVLKIKPKSHRLVGRTEITEQKVDRLWDKALATAEVYDSLVDRWCTLLDRRRKTATRRLEAKLNIVRQMVKKAIETAERAEYRRVESRLEKQCKRRAPKTNLCPPHLFLSDVTVRLAKAKDPRRLTIKI